MASYKAIMALMFEGRSCDEMLSPSRYINTHSASGPRRNRLSIVDRILPRHPAGKPCRPDLDPRFVVAQRSRVAEGLNSASAGLGI
ncbi:hypothetical protein RCH07_003346 [Arthrobacter sp. CG_A4]|nr:hypothetical protein [Arthrobacter sp. CG_A4]